MGRLRLHSKNLKNPSASRAEDGEGEPRAPALRELRAKPVNLIDPRFDQESCGVGFVAQLSGEPSREILGHALTALARLAHRGAVAADGKSSDGVGVMTAIPRDLLLSPLGIELDHSRPLGVAVVFLEGESMDSR